MHLTTMEKVASIEQSGLRLAWDGCHKIYFLDGPGEEADAKANGYDTWPSTAIRMMLDKSCGLEFVHPWNLGKHDWNINQGDLDEAGYYETPDAEVP